MMHSDTMSARLEEYPTQNKPRNPLELSEHMRKQPCHNLSPTFRSQEMKTLQIKSTKGALALSQRIGHSTCKQDGF